jgi:hypothetical protein
MIQAVTNRQIGLKFVFLVLSALSLVDLIIQRHNGAYSRIYVTWPTDCNDDVCSLSSVNA